MLMCLQQIQQLINEKLATELIAKYFYRVKILIPAS